MTAPLQPDVIAIYGAYLGAQAAVTAIVPAGRIATVVKAPLPSIRLTLIPTQSDVFWSDAEIQVDCYATNEGTAYALARAVAAVTSGMAAVPHSGGKVPGAAAVMGPYSSTDPDVQGEFRYILTVLVTATP